MFDFGARPPEVNSGLMYNGPGSGSIMAAASAWDALAAELGTAAQGYSSVMSELTSSPWVGPSSRTMLAAVTPLVTWINGVAAQAEETASQARAAAAAYETAFMCTVPPPVIAANRVQLMTLIATNFFGQNSAAIAATEAAYMVMWAEDAGAMYGYAASSATATQLTQFDPAPNTTAPDAEPNQAAAVAQALSTPAGNTAQNTATQMFSSAVPQALQQAAAQPAATTSNNFIWNTIQGFLTQGLPTPGNNWLGLTPANYTAVIKQTLQAYFAVGIANFGWSIGQQLFNGPAGTTAGAGGAFFANPAFTALGAGGYAFHPLAPAIAHVASATKIGGLSVPQSWLNAPGMPGAVEGANVKLVSAHMPAGGFTGAEGNPGTNGLVRGVPPMGARSAQRAGNMGVRYGFRYSVLCRPPSAG